jgi:hypothetical protein
MRRSSSTERSDLAQVAAARRWADWAGGSFVRERLGASAAVPRQTRERSSANACPGLSEGKDLGGTVLPGDIRDVQCVAHPFARNPAVHPGDVFDGSCGIAKLRPCRKRQSAQAARRRLCGCGPRSSRTCPTRASTSGTPHRSSALPAVPPRTPHHRPRSATDRRPARRRNGPRERRTPGRRPNRRLRGQPPARSSAAIDCLRIRGTGPQTPNMPGQTGIPSRRRFPPGTAARPPSRPPRMAPTPHRSARPEPRDETTTPRAGQEREEGLHSVQAPQQHTGPPGHAPGQLLELSEAEAEICGQLDAGRLCDAGPAIVAFAAELREQGFLASDPPRLRLLPWRGWPAVWQQENNSGRSEPLWQIRP